MSEQRPRVFIVDDSRFMRELLTRVLGERGLEVAGVAGNAQAARQGIRETDPDVITLDVEMPGMNGLDFLEKIMKLRPTPVVMISSLTQEGASETVRALEAGAVDCIAKPDQSGRGLENQADDIAGIVRNAASARVRAKRQAPRKSVSASGRLRHDIVVAVGASTGGVEALGSVVPLLPSDMPPIVIAQHIPERFVASFAERLDRASALQVRLAEDRMGLEPGTVTIAHGDRHLEVGERSGAFIARMGGSEPYSGHVPSVDVLMHSVATAAGHRAVGVMLTGMGRDGADGMKAMCDAGCPTIGQDEATSLVYGMPRAAYDKGAVTQQAPLGRIAPTLVDVCTQQGSEQGAARAASAR